jgi:hypothetical protein
VKKIISIIALIFALPAFAWDVEASIGQSYAQKAEDGIYYQERFRHDTRLQGQFFALGATDKFSAWGRDTRWRVYGFYMGSFSNDADAVQDENYAPKSSTGCGAQGCGQFSNYRTELSTRGVAATIAPEFRIGAFFGKPVTISPEIGIAAYYVKLDEDVTTIGEANSYRGYHYKWGLNAGEVFGVGMGWGNVRLSVKRYKINLRNDGNDWRTDIPSSVGELVNVVSLDWRF